MRFVNPIPFVKDVRRSTAFYRDDLGLAVVEDHGDFVMFEGNFTIHDGAALARTVWGEQADAAPPGDYGCRNLLLYFEDNDIDGCFARLRDKVRLIHEPARQAWGQRVFRFYDPDGHVVEIGEPMA